MAWFAFARVCSSRLVGYSASQLQPLLGDRHSQHRFRRRPRPADRRRSSCASRTCPSRTCSARCSAAPSVSARARRSARRSTGRTSATHASSSSTASSCSALPYLGLVMGARNGEWLEPERIVGLFRNTGPRSATDPRHQRHHRRPDRRHLRNRIHGRHARDPAVRAEGAAARRRLVGLDEAQPRPPRPRHPAEDSEDGGRRRDDLRHGFPGRQAKSI